MTSTVKASELDATWRKSTKSGNFNCVEVAPQANGNVAVRHSLNPEEEVLVYTPDEWAAFIAGVKNGEFDFPA